MTNLFKSRHFNDVYPLTIPMKSSCLAALTPEIIKWTSAVPVVISAPTGAGKTTWVCGDLTRTVALYGKKTLLLVNRTALTLQIARNLLEKIYFDKAEKYYAAERDRMPKALVENKNSWYDFGSIIVMTLQKFTDMETKSFLFNNIGAVVVDEAHFFMADALFNAKTGNAFDKIFSTFYNSLKIFISATPQNILPAVEEKGMERVGTYMHELTPIDAIRIDGVNAWVVHYQYHHKCYYQEAAVEYTFPVTKQNYTFVPLEDKGDFVSTIKPLIADLQNDKAGKTIIFINDKSAGEAVVKELEAKGITAVFVDSGTKNKDVMSPDWIEYEKIIGYEKFGVDVLVCTSVLDNGININDRDVKNIFVCADNETAFKQMVGRVRFPRGKSNYNVKVYFVNYNIGYFSQKFKYYNNILDDLKKIVNPYAEDERTNIDYIRYCIGQRNNVCKVIGISKKNEFFVNFFVNPFTMAALEDLIAHYQRILKALNGESIEKYSAIAVGKVAYLSVVSAWFNNMYSIPGCDEYYQKRKKVEDFLEKSCNGKARYSKEGQSKIKKIMNDFSQYAFGSDVFELKSIGSINKFIANIGLDYRLESVQDNSIAGRPTLWIVKRGGQKND